MKSASSSNATFSATAPPYPFTVAAGKQQDVTVHFAPSAGGAVSASLTIASDDPTRGSVTVALTGTGVGATAAPKIGVSPAALNFGSVTVGQTKDLTVTVINTGNATLTIGSIAGSDPQFTIPTTLASVVAGGSGLFTVRFKPAAGGPQSGTLTIKSNDPLQSTFTTPIMGTGIAAPVSSDMTLKVDGGSFSAKQGFPAGSMGFSQGIKVVYQLRAVGPIELLVMLGIIVLIASGRPLRRPPSHPMPADDSRILNRKRSRWSWGYWFLKD